VLPLYLGEVGVPDSRVAFLTGVIFTVAAGAAALGNQTSGWLLGLWQAGRLVAWCAVVAAVCAVVFAAGGAVGVLLAASAVLGAAMGVATTAVYTEIGHRVPAELRSTAFGYLQTAYLIGLAVSPVVAGLIGARSMRAVFVADAVGLACVAALVYSRLDTGAAPA
jgi:MFS family permease